MPPKRGNTTRSNGVARRGRASARGRAKGGRDHARVLSDITEESASQVQVQETPVQQAPKRATGGSKKRSFEDSAGEDSQIVTPARRETRAQAAKRSKQDHGIQTAPVSAVQEPDYGTNHINAAYQEPLHDFPTFNGDGLADSSLYTPSLNLLFFIHLSSLDTDADTEIMTLSLIELTLTAANWHTGLSGMVQPAACFLIASLLTRKQNLVEDVAASAEILGLGYGELVEGYRLLWERRDNMAVSVGGYAERLADLPEPTLLLALGEPEGVAWEDFTMDESFDERPEPER